MSLLPFHKRTFFPSEPNTLLFSREDEKKIFFSSGSKIVLFDFFEGKKIKRINSLGRPILYMRLSNISEDFLYILDFDGLVYKFCLSSKSAVWKYKMPEGKKYIKFELKNEEYIYLLSNDTFFTKLKIIKNKDNKEEIKKVFEYQIIKGISNPWPIVDFIVKEDFLIFPLNKTLFIHNILKKENENLQFQRRITALSAGKGNSLFIGDSSGVLFFLNDFSSSSLLLIQRHWHAHLISSIYYSPQISQSSPSHIYTCGKEGVLVSWDAFSLSPSFFPRLGEEIKKICGDENGKYLGVFLGENKVEIFGAEGKRIMSLPSVSQNSSVFFFVLHINTKNTKGTISSSSLPFFIFFSPPTGIISLYNPIKNSFDFLLDVFRLNFCVSDKKKIKNRKMKFVAVSSIKNRDKWFMGSYEELTYSSSSSLFLSYIKFWEVSNGGNLRLLCVCENPHDGEKISYMSGSSHKCFSFLTLAETQLKIWNFDQNNYNFYCSFFCTFKNLHIKSASFFNSLVYECGFALFEGVVVKYVNYNIYSTLSFKKPFPEHLTYVKSEIIILYNKKKLYIVDASEKMKLIHEDEIKEFYIHKVEFDEEEEVVKVLCGRDNFNNDKNDNINENNNNNDDNKNENNNNNDNDNNNNNTNSTSPLYLLKFDLSQILSSKTFALKSFMVIKKKKYCVVENFRSLLFVVNEKNEVFVADQKEARKEKNEKLENKEKVKKRKKNEMDIEDIELK